MEWSGKEGKVVLSIKSKVETIYFSDEFWENPDDFFHHSTELKLCLLICYIPIEITNLKIYIYKFP